MVLPRRECFGKQVDYSVVMRSPCAGAALDPQSRQVMRSGLTAGTLGPSIVSLNMNKSSSSSSINYKNTVCMYLCMYVHTYIYIYP